MSQQIDKLTPEQEAQIPAYVDKWVKIGLDTERLDVAETERIIRNFRRIIEREVDCPVIIVDNPLEAWAACHLLSCNNVALEDLNDALDRLFDGNPDNYSVPPARLPWQSGSFFASTFSYYDFMVECVNVEVPQNLYKDYKEWEETSKLGCIYPMEDYTVVSQKPTQVHLNENNVLHRDGGPALAYAGRGDMNYYSLNGVRVDKYIAETPEEQIDLDYYNTINNADVKAEFVRKVGIERFKSKGRLMDTYENYPGPEFELWRKSQYELWDMEALFDGLDSAPFLSMVNQTTGIFHFEGVSPDCRDLKAAIKQRMGGRDLVIKEIA